MEVINYVMGQEPCDYVTSTQFSTDVLSSFVLLISIYLVSYHLFSKEQQQDEKKIGWILTLFIAAYSSLSFFVWMSQELYQYKTHPLENIYGSNRISERLMVLNCVYFVMDNIGMDYIYPGAADLQAKLHHYAYLIFMGSSLYLGCPNLFLAYGLVEVPTTMLGIGKIWPEYRTDLELIIVFFFTRIVYHAYTAKYLYDTFSQSPFTSALFGACMSLGLHIYWLFMFVKSWKKHLKKKNSLNKDLEDGPPEFRMFTSNSN